MEIHSIISEFAVKCAVKVVFIYPSFFWLLLIMPALQLCKKSPAQIEAISIPGGDLLQKIIGTAKNFNPFPLLWIRQIEIALLIIALTEPMLMLENAIIRGYFYFIAASALCFFVEVTLKNVFLRKIP